MSDINQAIAAMKYAVDALDSIAEQVSIPKGTIAHKQLREVVKLADKAESLRAQLSEAQARLAEIDASMRNAYCHIQHEAYNDALSSILEAQGIVNAAPVSPAAQVAPLCHHEAYQGRCIHCDAKFVDGYVELDAMLAAAQQQKEGK